MKKCMAHILWYETHFPSALENLRKMYPSSWVKAAEDFYNKKVCKVDGKLCL